MKSCRYSLLAAIIMLLSTAPAQLLYCQPGSRALPDSSISLAWINGSWQTVAVSESRYDNNGKIIMSSQSVPVNNKWTTVRRQAYSYDTNGNQSEKKSSYLKDFSKWVEYSVTKSEYNEQNKKISSIPRKLIGSNGDPDYAEKRDFDYNENGKLTSEVVSLWKDGEWSENFRIEYAYDVKGRKKLELYYHTLAGSRELFHRRLVEYDDIKHTDNIIYQKKNQDAWADVGREFIKKDTAGMPLERIIYMLTPSGLKENMKVTYEYDAKGNQTQEAWQSIAKKGRPENVYRSLAAYDKDGNVTEETEQYWMNNMWINDGKTAYTYKKMVSAKE